MSHEDSFDSQHLPLLCDLDLDLDLDLDRGGDNEEDQEFCFLAGLWLMLSSV